MRKCVSLLLAAVLSLAFAPAPLPKPDSTKEDLKKMQGTWAIVSLHYEGKLIPKGGHVPYMVIAGNWLAYSDRIDKSNKWALTLDARKAPRTFDMLAERHNGGAWGIYELRGDVLIRCLSIRSALERPKGFDSSKPGCYLQVLKRVKR